MSDTTTTKTMEELVDEIRAYGKYAFWDDENRQKKYSSEYIRIKNNKNNNSDKVEN
ncbi:hypothetical protein [Marinifilum fragile]|uniref:hypothetical protein n=1 Tax=Marinifilum fragile TaxID=570161 RepID=UPI002AAADAE7|nr:hypothetical protein [Marinifilum fragile]